MGVDMKRILLVLTLFIMTVSTACATQHDFDISTSDANTGVTMRSQINAALQAIVNQSAGATEPGTKYPYQFWADTTNGLLKIRNAGNTAWVSLFTLSTGRVLLSADSDTLDGQHGSYYQPASTAITTSNIGSQTVASAGNSDTLDGNHASAFATAAQGAKADAAQPAATAITTSNIGSQSVNYAASAGTLSGSSRIPFAASAAFRGALVYNNALPYAARAILFSSALYDTDSIHVNSSGYSHLVVPSGVTKVKLYGQAISTAAALALYINKNSDLNSSIYVGKAQSYPAGTTGAANWITNISSAVLTVTAGDYFTLVPSNQAAADNTGMYNWFAMEIVE